MRILYDHQVFSLQDAGGASRYHFELVRNLQGSDGVEIEMLMGLNNSVMPFANLRQAHTNVLARNTGTNPGMVRYAVNELFSGNRQIEADILWLRKNEATPAGGTSAQP